MWVGDWSRQSATDVISFLLHIYLNRNNAIFVMSLCNAHALAYDLIEFNFCFPFLFPLRHYEETVTFIRFHYMCLKLVNRWAHFSWHLHRMTIEPVTNHNTLFHSSLIIYFLILFPHFNWNHVHISCHVLYEIARTSTNRNLISNRVKRAVSFCRGVNIAYL